MALPDWIRLVVAHRRESSHHAADSARIGLRESAAAGVTMLGEIATAGWSSEILQAGPPRTTVFRELIGLADEAASARLAEARDHLQLDWPINGCRPGLSPHAPYTVHEQLLQRTVQLAASADVPLAMHLAESREELRLLDDHGGPFREMLEEFGVWNEAAIPRGSRPLDVLQRLSAAPRTLVVHGNYLDAEEIALLAAQADRMSVVYCPRTHRYFDHEPYPLAEMLSAGVTVALGTDSRASNPDLSLLEEMRAVARLHPDISLEAILRLGTYGGARALGRQQSIGSIRPGKKAHLAVIGLDEHHTADPHELLLHSQQPVLGTWMGRGLVAGDSRLES